MITDGGEHSIVDTRRQLPSLVSAAEHGTVSYITRRGVRVALIGPVDMGASLVGDLERLVLLHDAGKLTGLEFAAAKQRLLAGKLT